MNHDTPPAAAAGGLDLDTGRRMLRAYEQANCARAAALLVAALGGPGCEGGCGGPDVRVSRRALTEMWKARWPHHLRQTGGRSVAGRLRTALSNLEIAGIIHRDGPNGEAVEVLDPARLGMSAGNLAVLVNPDGDDNGRHQWPRLPDVPEELAEAQAAVAEAWAAAEAARVAVVEDLEIRATGSPTAVRRLLALLRHNLDAERVTTRGPYNRDNGQVAFYAVVRVSLDALRRPAAAAEADQPAGAVPDA